MSVPLPLGEMVFPVIGCARCVVWCYRFCGVITRDANSLTRGVVTRHARQSVVVGVVVVTFSLTRFEPVWLFLRPLMIQVLTFTASKTKIETLILLLWRGIRSRLAKFHSGTCLHYFTALWDVCPRPGSNQEDGTTDDRKTVHIDSLQDE